MDSFDPAETKIPVNLRKRIEAWGGSPPKSQFKQYGPLNGYFGLKFPPCSFLVKPQALLREVDEDAVIRFESDDYMPTEGAEDISMEFSEDMHKDLSFDSQGVPVSGTKHYPDFTICRFYGADEDDVWGDQIRVVVEIASLRSESNQASAFYRHRVVEQLARYMNVMGEKGLRWSGLAVGIAILGTEVAFIVRDKGDWVLWEREGKTWFSLYGQEFVQHVNDVANYKEDDED